MPISIYIEDQVHKRSRVDFPYDVEPLIAIGPQNGTLSAISPHGDTMLNVGQLRALLDELPDMHSKDSTEQDAVHALRDLAERAIRLRGYLWFSGD